MLMKCQHLLSSGHKCGRKAENNLLCDIHSSKFEHNSIGYLEALGKYIDETIDGVIDLYNITFPKDLEINGNIFNNRPVIFKECTFNNCRFEDCHLSNVDFSGSTFKNTFFNKCIIEGQKAVFNECTFKADVGPNDKFIFGFCTINVKYLKLSQLQWYCDQIPFAMCSINAEDIDFSAARITNDDLSIGIWHGESGNFNKFHMILNNPQELNLAGLIFKGEFQYGFWREHQEPNPVVYFNHLNFSTMKSARFIDANLERAIFDYSQIEDVDFINAIWPTQNNRKILYNDTPNMSYKDINALRRTYIQLKKNFEEKRDYDSASDWHFREMEAKRKSLTLKWKPWKFISFIAIYKWFSNYGEGYKRALFWLLVWVFLFSGLFLYSGFSESNVKINYDCDVSTPIFCNDGFWGHLWSSIVYSLTNMTFTKSNVFMTDSTLTEFWKILQKLLTTLSFSLFLLALRRQFRR